MILAIIAVVLGGLSPESTGQPRPGAAVIDFSSLVPARSGSSEVLSEPSRTLERISTAVPWPRGVAWVDDDLVVLARGRHRRAGGFDPSIPDRAGTLFKIDPAISEPVVPGELASRRVRENGVVLAGAPSDPERRDRFERPYCTLVFDPLSKNLFICGYSGVDLPDGRFRKNPADSIHRHDLRDGRWYPVEFHDASSVPPGDGGPVVSNDHYPHHDPSRNPPPHGWLNGGNGGCVVGDFLYFVSKDNHRVVQYELEDIRARSDASPPQSRVVIESRVALRHPSGVTEVDLLGPSAAAARDGFLYLGYRTSSVVVRFALEADGSLKDPGTAELIAVFEPWSDDTGRSANLIDLAFDPSGALHAACAEEGRIWRIGEPDPARPFFGDDQREDRQPDAPPYVDLPELLGKCAGCGNIVFDEQGRLYLCSGACDTESETLRGVIYRVSP